jgi:cation transporter-like permease
MKRSHLVWAVVTVAGLAVVAGFMAWAVKASWALGGSSKMTIHGWIALGLAFALTGLLGGGLMFLAFYSARKGYDDDVGKGEEED